MQSDAQLKSVPALGCTSVHGRLYRRYDQLQVSFNALGRSANLVRNIAFFLNKEVEDRSVWKHRKSALSDLSAGAEEIVVPAEGSPIALALAAEVGSSGPSRSVVSIVWSGPGWGRISLAGDEPPLVDGLGHFFLRARTPQ